MSAIPGMRGSGDWSTPDERPKNYREMAFKLFPDSPSPFTYVLSKLPSKAVDDPEYKIFEWRLPVMAVTYAAEADTAEKVLAAQTTGASVAFKEGDILRNERTGEQVRVDSAPTSPYTNLTVTRGWGGTTAAAILDADVFRWVTSAYAEGTRSPTSVTRSPTTRTNYTQISKDTVKVTGTAEQMRTRPMKPWEQLKGECLERHMIKLEYTLIYGVPHEDTTSFDDPLRTSGGLDYWITLAGQDIDFSAGTSMNKIEDAMEQTFRYGSRDKIAFCGNRALLILTRAARSHTTIFSRIEDMPREKTWGLSVTKLTGPFGTLSLVPHPLMTESVAATKDMYIIDPKYVEYVYMRGRDTKWKDRVEENDEDGRKGFFQTEFGLRLALPEVHAKWSGLNAYAADS